MRKLPIIILLLILCPSLAWGQTTEKKPTNKAVNKQPKQNKDKQLDWGDWDQKFKPQQRYGVGIKGKLQSAISTMDKSNLLQDATGVKVTDAKAVKNKTNSALDIKKMKQELKALEKKVEHEIDNDIDL